MKKLKNFLLAACLLLALAGCAADPVETTAPAEQSVPTNTMTGQELMNEMKIGWNLGNTFDAPDGELSWGNPVTTGEMIRKVKELGFNTIRIPISWHKHVGEAPEYAINENWLKRIDMVVNDALDAGLYVIINSHHDNDQYMPVPDNREAAKGYLSAIWSQIADHFKDADYRLIFQTMNEPRVVGSAYEWSVNNNNQDCVEAQKVVNELNQTALDAIRATGGKNADRFVIVSPYAGSLSAIWSQIADHFKDADYRLIFQTMNEPRVVGSAYEWSVNNNNQDCVEAQKVVNELNQTALDAIRATGGKNADRFVIVSPYAGSPGAATSIHFQLPEDSAEGKLIVSVHAYTPYNLCLNVNSTESGFTQRHAAEIDSFMKSVNFKFVQKGIPVIIDEMGCINKDNPEARNQWARTYISTAREYGMICCWWDNGVISGSGERFGLLDRRKLEVYGQSRSAYEGLMEGLTLNAAEG